MASDDLFTREEVLGGLPARRAATLLFLIESRTAHLATQSRQAMETFLTEEVAKERERLFLDAFSLGREPPRRPTIQDLETYALLWAPLVPHNPRVRAAVAHLLGQKYAVTVQDVPSLRAALGLDDTPVQRAYQHLYGAPLESLYTPRPTVAERLRWTWTSLSRWLEGLPPFWTAFALTLSGTIRAGVLALPIAVAEVGPLPGLLLLLVFGLISLCTMISLAEAVSRHGALRYSRAFLGRVVADYLGPAGSLLLSGVTSFSLFLALVAYYIGAPSVLAEVTQVPAGVWVAGFFLCGLYFLSRQSLSATVASSLLVAAINVGILLFLSLLAFPHVRLEYLSYVNVPFLDGRQFDPSVLRIFVGTSLIVYYGHVTMVNAAGVVLRRDPSARSLIWGSVTALLTAMPIYGIWVLAVNGSVVPQALVGYPGTALTPLSAQVGPVAHVFGVLLAILLLGMASVHAAFGLFNLVRERLPTRSRMVVVLPRRRHRLLLQPRRPSADSPHLGLTYVGLVHGVPQCRLDIQCAGRLHHIETTVSGRWEAVTLYDRLPELRHHGIDLSLEPLRASPEQLQVQVTSSMQLTAAGGWDTLGLSMANVLSLPDADRQLVSWILRQGEMDSTQVAAHLSQAGDEVQRLLQSLVEQGVVSQRTVQGTSRYRVCLVPRPGRQLRQDIWDALGTLRDTPAKSPPSDPQSTWRTLSYRLRQALVSERGRFWLGISPMALAFLLTEWLLLTGAASFSRINGFLGVVTVSLVSGVFPVLLLVAGRRKGEVVPGVVFRVLGQPWVVIPLYLFFNANLFLHGLVIWDHPVERAAALVFGTLMLGMTLVMIRRGAFRRRLVVEWRDDQRDAGGTVFSVVAGGQPVPVEVQWRVAEGEQRVKAATGDVPAFSTLQGVTFHLPPTAARELKVWVHTITSDGTSEPLPAQLEVHDATETRQFDLTLLAGQVIIPLTGAACQVTLHHPEPSTT